ncbi:MAG: DUF427 domain-containing protein [Rhizobiaceae bacterium]|nr:DUF427 domain-containing protein [Rhizobiaceae bacterium]
MSSTKKIDISPIEGAIRNPDNSHHFMVLKQVKHTVEFYHGDALLAKTNKALRVIELGKSVYGPVLYIPTNDIVAPLNKLGKQSHCPLKGTASYFAHDGEEIAWSYANPLYFATELANYYGFLISKTWIREGKLN